LASFSSSCVCVQLAAAPARPFGPFCSCCKPSVFVIITAHVKDYDTALFAFYYDRYSCMKLDALESLVPFGSSTFLFFPPFFLLFFLFTFPF
jgi:hypothetical protein